jgi:hypothetical protein
LQTTLGDLKVDEHAGGSSIISGMSEAGNGKKEHHFHAWLYVDKDDENPGDNPVKLKLHRVNLPS